jgi:hypothetical protein
MTVYLPWDQEKWLGEPPWKADDPEVIAWEAAHNHDVRLKCYPEYQCRAIENKLELVEAENEQLREALETVMLVHHGGFDHSWQVQHSDDDECADATRPILRRIDGRL